MSLQTRDLTASSLMEHLLLVGVLVVCLYIHIRKNYVCTSVSVTHRQPSTFW